MVFFSESKLRDWLLRNSRLQKPCHPYGGLCVGLGSMTSEAVKCKIGLNKERPALRAGRNTFYTLLLQQ